MVTKTLVGALRASDTQGMGHLGACAVLTSLDGMLRRTLYVALDPATGRFRLTEFTLRGKERDIDEADMPQGLFAYLRDQYGLTADAAVWRSFDPLPDDEDADDDQFITHREGA